MKILHEEYLKDGVGTVSLICEESEDLWHLFNLTATGDRIKAMTTRKVSKESATGTVSSEVKKLNITIEVTKDPEYDAAGDSIRFPGKNCDENPWLKMGAHHTLEIGLNNKVTIHKENWDAVYRDALAQAADPHKSAEVAVVLIDAGVANFFLLTQVLAKGVCRISHPLPKKRITTTGYDKALVKFYEQVYTAIKEHIDFDIQRCIVLAGPGFVKDDFLKFMLDHAVKVGDSALVQRKQSFVAIHSSTIYKQALTELLADDGMQKVIANTKAAAHSKALEKFYTMLKEDPDRACYGPKQVIEANNQGALQTLMVTDGLFRSCTLQTRRQYVKLVEDARGVGAEVLVLSSQHVSGEQLTQLGGVAALLRFPVPGLEDLDD